MSTNDHLTVTPAGANVYAALGTPDAEGMFVKAQLATRISVAIKRKGLNQLKASAIINMPNAKLSKMLRGQFRSISERKMMDCLLALGENIVIDIKPAPAGETGRLSVRTKAYGRPSRAKEKLPAPASVRETA